MKTRLTIIFCLMLVLQGFSQCFTKVITEGNTGNDHFNGMSQDKNGNIYMTGFVYNTTTFGQNSNPQVLTNGGFFLSKYDSSLNLIWIKKLPSWPYAIATDTAGNSYITGNFLQSKVFGEGAFATTLTSYNNTWDIYIAKFNTNGDLLWARKDGGPYIENANALAIDNQGNCYVAGDFYHRTVFGDGVDSVLIIGSGEEDHFVAAYNNSGDLKWVKTKGGPSSDFGNDAVVVNHSNEILVASNLSSTDSVSSTTNSLNITKYDENGNVIWQVNETGAGAINNHGVFYLGNGGICVDDGDNFYLTGSFSNTCFFGGQSITSQNLSDLFLTKYNTNGMFQNLYILGDQKTQHGFVVGERNNRIYLGAVFSNSVISMTLSDNSNVTFNNSGDANGSDGLLLIFDSTLVLDKATHLKEGNLLYMNKFLFNTSNNKILVGGSFDYSLDLPTSNGNIITSSTPDNTGTGSPQFRSDIFIAEFDPNCLVTDVEVNEQEGSFNIFPNPTNGLVTVTYLGKPIKTTINIRSPLGQIVLSKSVSLHAHFNECFNLGSQSKGVYLIEILSENTRQVRKIILD